MGIDHLYVDESHKFKNLTFTTRHDRVAGLGNPEGSQRALNMLFALRTIQQRTGRDLGATFLSGTTISNSLTELYLLFKYLRPKELERQNIRTFDAWADVYKRQVYEMVAGRMLETFSGACVKENTFLTLQSAGHDFTARGSIMVETGWRAVLNEPVEEKEEDMTLLPDIVQGDELPVKECGTEQKQTRPRPLHTESSLLAAMETAGRELSDEAEREAMKDAGIGTPATQ